MTPDEPISLDCSQHWDKIKHCAPFAGSFEVGEEREDWYTLNRSLTSGTAAVVADLKEKHNRSTCTTWVGEHGVEKEADLVQMNVCVTKALSLIARHRKRAKADYAFFASQEHPQKDSSCFTEGLWEDIEQSVARERENNGPETYALVVHAEQDQFSKPFVEGWLGLIAELGIEDRVFLAVLGKEGDSTCRSEFTYGLSDVIVNIGSTYKDAGFRYNIDAGGNVVVDDSGNFEKTSGYKEICSLLATPGVEELFITDKPKGLCVLTHG